MFGGSAAGRWLFAHESESHILNHRAFDRAEEALERLR
jgi:hypothetical protein